MCLSSFSLARTTGERMRSKWAASATVQQWGVKLSPDCPSKYLYFSGRISSCCCAPQALVTVAQACLICTPLIGVSCALSSQKFKSLAQIWPSFQKAALEEVSELWGWHIKNGREVFLTSISQRPSSLAQMSFLLILWTRLIFCTFLFGFFLSCPFKVSLLFSSGLRVPWLHLQIGSLTKVMQAPFTAVEACYWRPAIATDSEEHLILSKRLLHYFVIKCSTKPH